MKMNKKASLEFVADAVLTPCTHFNLTERSFDGGVFDDSGRLIESSLHEKGDFKNTPLYTQPVRRLQGTFIYAGLLQNFHFGHFLIESLSRLWPLKNLKIAGVVFISREQSKTVAPFVESIFNKLGINNYQVCLESTKFESLIIPSQLAMEERGYVMGYPQIKDFLSKLVIKTQSFDKVYVSRSSLKKDEGGFLGEASLERSLEKEGYHIVHPQNLTIDEQLEVYSNAKKIIFADGSAFHLYVLVASSYQDTFVVWRRNKMASFAFQYQSFVGKDLQGQPTQKGFFQVDSSYPISRRKSVLDFCSLKEQLVKAGFISGSAWQAPEDRDIQNEINLLQNRNKTKYQYVEL